MALFIVNFLAKYRKRNKKRLLIYKFNNLSFNKIFKHFFITSVVWNSSTQYLPAPCVDTL